MLIKSNLEEETKSSIKLQNKVVIFVLATCCCLLWGSAFPSVKIGYSLFDIHTTGAQILFAGYRFTMAGVLTLIMACLFHRKWIIPGTGELKGMLTENKAKEILWKKQSEFIKIELIEIKNQKTCANEVAVSSGFISWK